MSDETSERNERFKATMREKNSTNLNTGPAQVPCGPKLGSGTKRPTGHVEPVSGRKS
jgi:hypothetical protein